MANIVKLNYTADEINEKLGKVDEISNSVGVIDSELDSLSNEIRDRTSFIETTTVVSKNLFNPTSPDWLVGYTITINGEIIEDSTRIVSNFVAVEAGEKLIYSHLFVGVRQTANSDWYFKFDSDKNFIGYTKLYSDSTGNVFTVPEGTAYIRYRIGSYASYKDYMLEKNTEITEYEPYFEPYSVNKIPEQYLDVHIPEKVSELENDSEYMPLAKKTFSITVYYIRFCRCSDFSISLQHYGLQSR